MKNKLNFTDGIIVSGMVDKVINTELQKEDIINEYKEELKEKINKLFNPKISNGEHSIQITKKEILELLK